MADGAVRSQFVHMYIHMLIEFDVHVYKAGTAEVTFSLDWIIVSAVDTALARWYSTID